MWQQLTSLNNLFLAYKHASRGKRSKPDVASYEFNLEENIFNLREQLIHGTYQHGAYHSFYIHDPKQRLISAADFKDRVVHHALCQVIEPLFEPKFIHDSYANRVGKGTHRALDRCTHNLRRYQYYLQLDIQQYFPAIDHRIMMEKLSSTIMDLDVLDLCENILRSGEGVLTDTYQMVYFPGDDLFALHRPRGLPIGNLTSQFWANVYLNELDHYIKRQLKCPGYIRYVDDMLLFGNDKKQLWDWWLAVVEGLAQLRLTVHGTQPQPTPVAHGVTFLGFRCFPGYRRLKRQKAVFARKKIKQDWRQVQQGDMTIEDFQVRLQSWINHARYGDTWGLRQAILQDLDIVHMEAN
jgi:RNA-directed DNA polymerase